MTEPQRTDPQTPPADAERETRIEELLVSGLDHYFAGDYEQAINIWTRVIFLDREHNRARAYIDRARKAIAERQRESEELLHRGLDAYKAGEVERARDLLTRAVDQGAPSDQALVLLGRMEQLEGTGFDLPLQRKRLPARRVSDQPAPRAGRRTWRWVAAAVGFGVVSAAVYFGAAPAVSWLVDVPADARPLPQAAPEPLPLVRTAGARLARARGRCAGGHSRVARRLPEAIGIADPARPEADRLRADIQRALLASVAAGAEQTSKTGPAR